MPYFIQGSRYRLKHPCSWPGSKPPARFSSSATPCTHGQPTSSMRRSQKSGAAERVLLVISVRASTLSQGNDMTTPDASAVGHPALSRFLFAEVGMQPNGLPLTILSVLARLGQDPWAEAARWTKLPKSTTVDTLARSIAQMPLAPQALAEARQTASRLVMLLPSQLQTARRDDEAKVRNAAKPKW